VVKEKAQSEEEGEADLSWG